MWSAFGSILREQNKLSPRCAEYPVPVVPSIGVPATGSFLILKIGYSSIELTSLQTTHIMGASARQPKIVLAPLVLTT